MAPTHIAAIELLSSAVIRILAGYLLVFALTRLASRASVRHILWFTFLIAASCYWLATARQAASAHSVVNSSPAISIESAHRTSSTLTTVTIPTVWNRGVESGAALLVQLYLLGVFVMCLRFWRRRLRLRHSIAMAQQASPELSAIFEDECLRFGISRCQILEMPELNSPGTAYACNPVVIMPEGIDAFLDDEQLVDVLCHELMHVKRLDFLWSSLAEFASCVLFFHPAAWLALRNLARDRELACDFAVMELRRGRTTDYASCLTRLARRQVAATTFESPNYLALLDSFLALRVQALLAQEGRSRTVRLFACAAAVGALCVFVAAWSSLALTVLVEGAATQVVAAVPSIVPPVGLSTRARRMTPLLQSATNTVPSLENDAESTEPVAQSDLRPFSPVDPSLDGGSGEYNDPESVVSTRSRTGGTPGDDRSPTMQTQKSPSWQKTAAAAAGALGHIAGGKRDNDGNADDRASRPF